MFNSYLEKEILKLCPNLDLYLAQNNASINDKTQCANSADIYVGDITRLKEADLLITIMSGDLPPIGSSYEVAYFCGLCERDPKKRIIALYDDCREATNTFSEAKNEAMLSGIAENQYPYINLLAVGFVKKWGNIYFNSEDFIQAVKREYDIGNGKIVQGVYSITNLKNGKKYIGQSKDIYKRWREHKTKGKETTISSAIYTYGEDYFKFQILETCPTNQLIEREQYWIDYYDSTNVGYNVQNYSTDPSSIENWNKHKVYGYTLLGEFVASFDTINEASISINRSTVGILKCLKYPDSQHSSGNMMWRDKYYEHIEQYSKSPSKRDRKIYCYNLDTRLFEKEYSTLTEASMDLGATSGKSHIPQVLRGERHSCMGHLWAEEYFERLPNNYYEILIKTKEKEF